MANTSSTLKDHSTPSAGHGEQSLFTPDVTMLILTWVTFFLLLAILQKYAWKPILAALEIREKSIRDSVDNAQRLETELAKLDEKQNAMIAEVEQKSKEIIDQSRKAATEAAKTIQSKAKEEAQILLENAKREIDNEKEKAQAELRSESAQIAVELAEKILEENLDEKKNRKLIDQFLKQI